MIMYNIIQTVHHDFGRKPSRTRYSVADEFYRALDMYHTLNVSRAEKNQREDSIAVTYDIEYHPHTWED